MGYHIIGADLTETTFIDQGTTVVLEDVGDKLGVGTDTPTARLHVVGIGGETETSIFYHSAAIYGSGNPFLHLSYGGTSTLDVYSDGADDFVMKANHQDLHVDTIAGKDLLLQESGGDVGIGTTTPDATLEVVGSGGETDTVRFYHSAAVYGSGNPFLHCSYAGASTLSVYSDGSDDFVVKANQNDLHVDTVASKNLLLQESGGNVGIGFDAPTQALHVKSATSAEPVVLIENSNADALTGTMRFYKNTASPAVADQIGLFKFVGKDAAGDDAEMAFIVCKSESVTDSDFEGGLHFGVASAGANAVSTLSLIGQGTAKTTYAVFGDPWEGSTNTKVGIGDAAPGTQLQITDTAPYVTLKNSTAENTAAGCESKIVFEDHGDNALGQIEVSHVGTSDDEKGQLILSTNNDSGLQAALTISEAQNVTVAGTVTTSAVYVNNGSGNDAALVLGDGTTNYWQVMYDAANADAAHRFIIYDSASPAVESPFVIEQGAAADSVYMDSTGVGILTGAPATPLHVVGDTTVESGNVTSSKHSNGAGALGKFVLQKSRGSAASPTAVQDGHTLGGVHFEGYDGDTYETGASIEAFVEGTPGDGDMPTKLVFGTTADGEAEPTARLTIGQGGAIIHNSAAIDGGSTVTTPLTNHATWYVTGGSGETSTLLAGTEGQVKVLAMKTDGGGDMVVTVTNAGWKSSGTGTITLADIGDGCQLQYLDSKWHAIGNNGCAFA